NTDDQHHPSLDENAPVQPPNMVQQIPKAENLTDLFSLKGKVVALTGASAPRGMGIEAARGCAEMGASVALTYASRKEGAAKNAKELADKYAARVKAYKLDMRTFESAQPFVRDGTRDCGHIDGFIAK